MLHDCRQCVPQREMLQLIAGLTDLGCVLQHQSVEADAEVFDSGKSAVFKRPAP